MSYQLEQKRTFRFLRLPSEAKRRRVRPLLALAQRFAPVLVIALLVAATAVWLLTAPAFALAGIEIHTAGRLDGAGLERRLVSLVGENLFRIDLERVSDLLTEEPWVRDLTVVKQLPNRLVVDVQEHQPMAVLQDVRDGEAGGGATSWWVDQDGHRIAPVDGDATGWLLLRASHPTRKSERSAALDLVRRLDGTTGSWHRRALETIRVLPTGDLELQFAGRAYPVLVEPKTAVQALSRYERLERPLVARGVKPRSVDLRFEGRVLVARASQEVG